MSTSGHAVSLHTLTDKRNIRLIRDPVSDKTTLYRGGGAKTSNVFENMYTSATAFNLLNIGPQNGFITFFYSKACLTHLSPVLERFSQIMLYFT